MLILLDCFLTLVREVDALLSSFEAGLFEDERPLERVVEEEEAAAAAADARVRDVPFVVEEEETGFSEVVLPDDLLESGGGALSSLSLVALLELPRVTLFLCVRVEVGADREDEEVALAWATSPSFAGPSSTVLKVEIDPAILRGVGGGCSATASSSRSASTVEGKGAASFSADVAGASTGADGSCTCVSSAVVEAVPSDSSIFSTLTSRVSPPVPFADADGGMIPVVLSAIPSACM